MWQFLAKFSMFHFDLVLGTCRVDGKYREAALSWTAQQLQHCAAQREDPEGTAQGPGEICGGDHADCSSCAAKAERISELM